MAVLRTGLTLLIGLCVMSSAARAEPPEEKPGRRTDLYGDPLPEGAIARFGSPRLRHAERVECVIISPDGTKLYSASSESAFRPDRVSIRVWDLATGKLLRKFGDQDGGAGFLALSQDGKILASKGGDGSVWLWNAETGQLIRHCENEKATYSGCIAFSPDGTLLASNGETILIWDVRTGKTLRSLDTKGHNILFTPDGRSLVCAGYGSISCLEATTGKKIRVIEEGDVLPLCLAITPDGKTLLSGYDQGVIRCWDTATGIRTRELTGHDKEINALVVSPDGKTLASGGRDGTVRLWDLATGELRRRIEAHSGVHALGFSPDSKKLVSGGADGNIRVWDTATGKELLPLHSRRNTIASVAFSPDGKTLAIGGEDKTVRLIDPATGKDRRILGGRNDWVEAVAFSPDGELVASCDYRDPAIRLWRVSTGKEVRQLVGHTSSISSLAFLPNSKFLASTGSDGTIRLWDTEKGAEIGQAVRDRKLSAALSISFYPDGKALASAERDGLVCVWDVATGRQLGRLVCDTRHFVKSVACAPYGNILASGGGDAAIYWWDALTGKELRSPIKHPGDVKALAFSPDGRLLISGGTQGCVCIWESATGSLVRKLAGHEYAVTSVACSPDGQTVASGSSDSTVIIWDVRDRLKNGQSQPDRLTANELENCWVALARSSEQAYSVVWTLAASNQAVQFLKERLRPVPPVAAERVARLIAELDSDEFATRERATKELEDLEERAEAALREAAASGSTEVRWRATRLLDKLSAPILPPERLRQLRAVAALEYNGTAAARELLRALAGGAAEARLTHEAKSALQRMEKRPAK
jgi:WD40 repeat protein